jgi:hypothetical protein
MRWTLFVLALIASSTLVLGAGRAGPATPAPADLARDKLAAAEQTYLAALVELESGTGTAEAVYQWSLRWQASGLQAGGKPVELGRAHLERMKALESLVSTRVTQGLAPASQRAAVAYYRLEAEIGAGGRK